MGLRLLWLLWVVALLAGSPAAALHAAPPAPSHVVTLRSAVPLSLALPSGYEVVAEHDDELDVFHVWRTIPQPLKRDTSLAVIVTVARTPFCPPETGRTVPADFPAWTLRWHICREPGAAATVWETFAPAADSARVVQIAIIGTDPAELQHLRAIAETLRPAGG